jgi:hypothetical protein
MVVSVRAKGLLRGDQVSIREVSVSEPLLKCRKCRDDVKTGELSLLRDKYKGNLSTACAASGMKVART